jgi:hypothetical protein
MAISIHGFKLTMARCRTILAHHGWTIGPRVNSVQYECTVTTSGFPLKQYKTLRQIRNLANRLLVQEIYNLQLASKNALPPEKEVEMS